MADQPQAPDNQAPPPGNQPPPPGNQPPPPSYAQVPPQGYAQPPPQGYAQPPPQGHAQQPPPPGYPQGYAQPPPQGYAPPPGQQVYPNQAYGNPGFAPQVGYAQPGQPYPQPGVQPIAGQPMPGQQAVQWMTRPETIPGCPPGLEYLTQIDQILVHQQVELLEAFTGWETNNKYQIKNSIGQQVYFAAEESDTCMRQCCGPQRGFTIHITDNANQEVIRVTRPFKCCAGCNCCAFSNCCQCEIEIQAPVGQTVGYVRQTCSFLAPKFEIMDAEMQVILLVEGPVCICQGPCCIGDQEFIVSSAQSGQEVGKISKQWSGLVKEYFTKADNFGVSFPMDLDVKMKSVMLGAVFLIDFMFFEQQQNNNNN